MTTNAELDILKGLGLPPYEAKVFLALIDIEQGTSADIHKASGVPRTSIYNICRVLVQKGLVLECKTYGPKMWMVLSVGVALEKVYQMVEKTHQTQRLLVIDLGNRWGSL